MASRLPNSYQKCQSESVKMRRGRVGNSVMVQKDCRKVAGWVYPGGASVDPAVNGDMANQEKMR